ncbi:MAG: aspartyl-phosphate phosphatase Spo0E family protein [Bacillota bacterium]
MSGKPQEVLRQIDEMRTVLQTMAQEMSLHDVRLLGVSKKLDQLLNEYYKTIA